MKTFRKVLVLSGLNKDVFGLLQSTDRSCSTAATYFLLLSLACKVCGLLEEKFSPSHLVFSPFVVMVRPFFLHHDHVGAESRDTIAIRFALLNS